MRNVILIDPAWKARLALGFFILLIPGTGMAQAKETTVIHGIRLAGGGAVQRPTTLRLLDARSSYQAHHVFLDMAYCRSLSAKYRMGVGFTYSWGRYGVSTSGTVDGPYGTEYLSASRWTSFIWHPVQAYFQEGRTFRTDPVHIYVEGTSILGDGTSRSWFEARALLGYMVPGPITLTIGAYAEGDPGHQRDPLSASTTFGYGPNFISGLVLERCYRTSSGNVLGIGLDWRVSLLGHFDQDIAVLPGGPNEAYLKRRARFMWLGLRVGYTFRWTSVRTIWE